MIEPSVYEFEHYRDNFKNATSLWLGEEDTHHTVDGLRVEKARREEPVVLRLESQRSRRRNRWVFRGQCDENWTLRPKTYRDINPTDTVRTRNNVLNLYVERLVASDLTLPFQIPTTFETHLEAKPPGALVAHAQHHECPTELLDFTYDPLVALHFAAHELVIQRQNFQTMKIREGSTDAYSGKYAAEFYDSCPDMVVWAIRINDLHWHTDLQVLDYTPQVAFSNAQKATFIWDTDWEDAQPHGRPFEVELRKLAQTGRNSIERHRISAIKADKIINQLSRYGISHDTLFPSFSRIGRFAGEFGRVSAELGHDYPSSDLDGPSHG